MQQCLQREIPLDRFGVYWSSLMLRTQRALRDASGSEALVMGYEELLASPDEQLQRLAGFLRVCCPSAWLALAREAIRPPTRRAADLPAAERAALERACRPGRRVLRALAARKTG